MVGVVLQDKKRIYPDSYIPFKNVKSELPQSETSFGINVAAMLIAFVIISAIKWAQLPLSSLAVLAIFVAVMTISVWGLEYACRGKKSWFDKMTFKRKIGWKRVGFKLLGIACIFAIVAFGYWVLPVYDDGLFVTYLEVLKSGLGGILLLTVVYFALMDKIEDEPEDAYWQLGRWLCGYRKDAHKDEMIELFRGWGVKFFYLALMMPYFQTRLEWFMQADFSQMFDFPYRIFYFCNEMIFLVDLAFAATGYMMTFRLFNTQIRSSEPTLLGWFAALACYWPFWADLFGKYYLAYNTGVHWTSVFADNQVMFAIWMVLILLCETIYSLATAALGLRFSNLTYRGLVSGGPYAYTKHPAYVFKNISWWLMSMPFMVWSENPALAVKGSCLLLGVNALYYLRAKTEERHLSHYPEYVEYALAMNKKSIFAPVAKILPFLKYKAPEK